MSDKVFEVKHKKRGLNNLLRHLRSFQTYYVSVGIHKRGNIITSGEKQKKDYKKIMAYLRKKEKDDAGIVERKRSGKSGKKISRFNLASLAYYLEQPVSWVQEETVRVQGVNNIFTIFAGARLKRPARIFISIFKLPNVWSGIKSFINTKVKYFAGSTNMSSRDFWNALGRKVQEEQQRIITSSSSAANTDLTTLIKGKNHPLFDTGRLLNGITFHMVRNQNSTGAKKIDKAKFLMNLDQEMEKLN